MLRGLVHLVALVAQAEVAQQAWVAVQAAAAAETVRPAQLVAAVKSYQSYFSTLRQCGIFYSAAVGLIRQLRHQRLLHLGVTRWD